MFDRTYFDAAKANGYQASSDISAPLAPAGLSDAAEKQWSADYEVLSTYAKEQERTLNPIKKSKAKKKAQRGDTFVNKAPSLSQQASTRACDAPKPPHPLRAANQELYAANKKLANENASAEAKLQRTRTTLRGLTSKIETKLDASQGHGDLTQRLSAAVNALLEHSGRNNSRMLFLELHHVAKILLTRRTLKFFRI